MNWDKIPRQKENLILLRCTSDADSIINLSNQAKCCTRLGSQRTKFVVRRNYVRDLGFALTLQWNIAVWIDKAVF